MVILSWEIKTKLQIILKFTSKDEQAIICFKIIAKNRMINDEVLNRNIVKKLPPAQNTLWFPVAEKQFIVTLNLKINSNYYRLKNEYIFFDLFELI